MRPLTIVILAAGHARRYGGLKQLAPIGLHGEGVIDLVASDAYDAGFSHVVLVVNPNTGPTIKDHVAERWPVDQRVSFCVQDRPLGTVHAVLSARGVVDPDQPFAVANADDLYGPEAMQKLADHLRTQSTNCLVSYQLDRAVVPGLPVTRGVCEISDGFLVRITERRNVQQTSDDFEADDGQVPTVLSPSTPVSMNLWGFQPAMWHVFESAMHQADASEEREIRLPDVVDQLLAEVPFAVLPNDARCVGVTHANDLPLVQADVRDQVARGERPARAFSS